MRKLALILASLLWATAALAQSTGSITLQQRPIGSGGPTFDDITTYANGKFQILDPLKYDFVGDSRTRDIFPSTCNSGAEPVSNCGTRGTNWFVIANALSGSRYKIGLDQAIIGTRPDQYLAPTNIAPMLASNAGNFVIGYPIINSLTPLNGANYTDTNGYTITPSNVANVNAANILAATKSAIAANKKVILQLEPGNPTLTNSAIGVSSFTGQTSGFVLTVTAVASGVIYTPQTVTINSLTGQLQSDPGSQILSGAGVTAGTLITAQLTGSDGATCPSVSCTGGIGTYSISTSLSIASEAMAGRYTLIGALADFNAMLVAIGQTYQGSVQVINALPAVYAFSGSTTAINFKTGALLDGDGTTSGTHFNALGGYYGAVAFNAQYQAPTPGNDLSASSSTDITGTNPRSLIAANNLFTGSASGGSGAASCTTTGTVPTGWTQACGNAGTAVTLTAPTTDTNQLFGSAAIPLSGNQFTVAITTSGADTYRLFPTAPANNFWNLSDYLQGNYVVNVAAGSSHCRVYAGLDYATAVNTRTTYANFSADDVASNGGSVDGPTTAYTYTLRTIPNAAQTNGGSSKSFTRYILYAQMSAAGNCTFTVSRPWFSRVRVYNPVTGSFSP